MDIVVDLIEAFDPEDPRFRPTEIYNETWLLRALLHHASESNLSSSPFSFTPGATWFSEALLPTVFKARFRGDDLAESRTNADGVIGHILIGEKGKADLKLQRTADQFTVIEAKIRSSLSAGTSNAPNYDQAARNVACIAEVLRRADLPPDELGNLSFIVLAPAYAIDAGTFSTEMERRGIRNKIQHRVEAYSGELDVWYREWAEPTLETIDVYTVSWEDVIVEVDTNRSDGKDSLQDFYELCLKFN